MTLQDLNELVDEVLMKRYGQGNCGAFERLYERHKGPLYRFVLRQIGDRSAAEELVQDIWSKVIAQRNEYHVSAKFTTWLYTIARNRVIDYYRAQGRRLDIELGAEADIDDITHETFVCEQRPELLLESAQSLEQIRQLVASLPASQREAFLLKFDGGFNNHDIAAITGHGEETIKSQIRYAISKLKQGLFGGRHD